MRQQFYLFYLVLTMTILKGDCLFAQKPVKTPPPVPGGSYKKPLVRSSLGTASGNIKLSVEAARQLVSQPLKIIDDKNVVYNISSYQLAYKRIGITEDEETGKTSVQSDIAANRFTTTPLPDVWQKNIVEGLHKGEELYFFDIIVLDKQGRRFFAPEIKIIIQ